ncbi:alpha/beta hydrolase [Mycobacterium sp. AZCC_0083]|uniref:alpha/beta hydrolase n=1 Tax=Mycobacterium sp. AZCC_0083 TaxID=2735882 RepID=UPI0016160A1D|nr:alpha/beta hydrolase [Mycobacterium sp. AZCC_0083]MBB5163662.1 acetyl esterase/lipase [Mycobacterium sp. AZCC_0083]
MPSEDFHPDLRRVARFAPRPLVSRRTLPLLRALAFLHLPRRRDDVEVVTFAAGAGVRLHRPLESAATAGALLWIHGGGYLLGNARQDDALCRRFALKLGITVGSVEYRPAPEHPFPAALEDCYAALQRLVALPGVDPARVAIGGASAGGGLAAALALMTRDRGEIDPALQLLVYPMLDDRTVAKSPSDARNYRVWTERSNRFGWAAYLGNANPDIAVPARNTDLAGLPPAWIGVGTLDLFHDENLAYAERLKKAGVPCRVEVVTGAFHGFDTVAPGAPVSQSFFDSQCASLHDALTAGSAA